MRDNFFNFLQSIGFTLLIEEESEYFGDYYCVFRYTTIELRLISTRSNIFVEIRKAFSNENWYDLAIIKALLSKENAINYILELDECRLFLEKYLLDIELLFDDQKYLTTKDELEILSLNKTKQMFPNLFQQK